MALLSRLFQSVLGEASLPLWAVDSPACWLLQIFPVWMGAKKSLWWRLSQLLGVMDELCSNQSDFFSHYTYCSVCTAWGFGVIFCVVLDKPFQSLSLGLYLWHMGIPVVTISAGSLGASPSQQADSDLSCRQRTDVLLLRSQVYPSAAAFGCDE